MEISTKGKYYGQKETELSFEGILLSKYDYPVDRTPWHYHENPYFMFVLHGNMIDGNKRMKSLLPTGSLMYNNWQEAHYGIKHSEQAGGFHLEFEKHWLEKNEINLPLLEGSQPIEQPRIHFLFTQLYREFILADANSEISVETLLIQICDALIKVKEVSLKETPHWIFKLKELLHDDPSKFDLKYLSDQLGVHPVHISRAAPQYFSSSLGEYVRQLKLKRALPLLQNTHYSLTEIAYQAGFADQSHFNRVFKAYFNHLPSTFRKQLLK
ncbi:MAG: helix-turn-helix transcriptional regulator [Thermonemataceae bacterium]